MNILTIDGIRSEILKHLYVKDIYSLKSTNKKLFDKISLDFYITRDICHRLKIIFGNKLDNFLIQMDKSGSVISGSFVLQVLLNEHWIGSDLDIFIPINGIKFVEAKATTNITELEDFIFTSFNRCSSERNSDHIYTESSDIEHVRNYNIFVRNPTEKSCEEVNIPDSDIENKNQLGLIQTIAIKIEQNEIGKFMTDYSDFDICRNWFGVKSGKPYCNIYRLHKIMDKNAEFRLGKKLSNTMLRYYKYKKYGFEFTNDLKPFLNDILKVSNVYNLYYVRSIKNKKGRYRILQGDVDKLNHFDMSEYGIIDTNILASCPDFLQSTCPVRFCFQNEIDIPEHFHLPSKNHERINIFIVKKY